MIKALVDVAVEMRCSVGPVMVMLVIATLLSAVLMDAGLLPATVAHVKVAHHSEVRTDLRDVVPLVVVLVVQKVLVQAVLVVVPLVRWQEGRERVQR